MWAHLASIDPFEHAQTRIKQKVYLARYARQGLFDWENREVSELDAYFAAVCEMIQRENEASRAQEDR